MNKSVNFEIAKLLKEKGINLLSSKLMYASNGKLTDSIYDFDEWCFAPTIAEVVMWLYEKHNIWIQVTVNDIWVGRKKEPEAKYNSEVVSQNRNLKVKSLITRKVRIEPYDSPIEAYEEAIKYGLTNLIS